MVINVAHHRKCNSIWSKFNGQTTGSHLHTPTKENMAEIAFMRMVTLLSSIYYPVQGGFFESVDEILNCDNSNESIEQYFPVVLFIMIRKVVLISEVRVEIFA